MWGELKRGVRNTRDLTLGNQVYIENITYIFLLEELDWYLSTISQNAVCFRNFVAIFLSFPYTKNKTPAP